MLPDKDFLDYLNTCDERKKKLVLLNFNTKRDEIDYEALATELNCTRDEAFMEMFNIQVQSRREWDKNPYHKKLGAFFALQMAEDGEELVDALKGLDEVDPTGVQRRRALRTECEQAARHEQDLALELAEATRKVDAIRERYRIKQEAHEVNLARIGREMLDQEFGVAGSKIGRDVTHKEV